MKNLIQKLIEDRDITEIYQTPEEKYNGQVFTVTENTNVGVFTFWKKSENYEVTQPIKPNHRTGSSLHLVDYPISEEELYKLITKTGKTIPNFFSFADIKATHHLTAKQDAEQPTSLDYIKIK